MLFSRTQGKILVVLHDLSYTCRVSHLNTDLMEGDKVQRKDKVSTFNSSLDVTIHCFQRRFCKLHTRVKVSQVSVVFSYQAPQRTAKGSSNHYKGLCAACTILCQLYELREQLHESGGLGGGACMVSLKLKEEDS